MWLFLSVGSCEHQYESYQKKIPLPGNFSESVDCFSPKNMEKGALFIRQVLAFTSLLQLPHLFVAAKLHMIQSQIMAVFLLLFTVLFAEVLAAGTTV